MTPRHTLPFAIPDDLHREKIRAQVEADIKQRLRRACQNWSDQDFQQLVDDATSIAIKYAV